MISINKKTSLTLCVILFLSMHRSANINAHVNNKNVLLGAFVVAGGIGAYAYNFYYDSIGYHRKIIDAQYKTYHRAQNYLPDVDILSSRFNVNATDFDVKANICRITEDLSHLLTNHIKQSGVDKYLIDLSSTILDLKSKNKSLERTVNKLKSKAIFAADYQNAFNLREAIIKLLPKLDFLELYVKNHKSYFKMWEFGNRVAIDFDEDIDILLGSMIEKDILENLKRHVRAKYYNEPYPYLKYVEMLNKNIRDMEIEKTKLGFAYPKLIKEADKLKNRLIAIRTFIVGDSEYHTEKRKFDDDKQNQAKLKKENELREREVRAKELHAEAVQRKAELEEYKFNLENN